MVTEFLKKKKKDNHGGTANGSGAACECPRGCDKATCYWKDGENAMW